MPNNKAPKQPLANPASQPQTTALSLIDKIANPLEAVKYLAHQLFVSKIGGFENEEQAAVVAWSALVNRKDPLQIVNENHIIDGKLTRKADVMLAKFKIKGGRVKWTKISSEEVAGDFTLDDQTLPFSFTMDDARQAGYCYKPGKGEYYKKRLDGQDGRPLVLNGHWAHGPAGQLDQLKARCITRAIGFMDPESKGGYSTPEEISDIVSDFSDRTPAFGAGTQPPPRETEAEVVGSEPPSTAAAGSAPHGSAPAPQPDKPKTVDELLEALKLRYDGSRTTGAKEKPIKLTAALVEGWLVWKKKLQAGEGLPSLKKAALEWLYNNQNEAERGMTAYALAKGGSNASASAS